MCIYIYIYTQTYVAKRLMATDGNTATEGNALWHKVSTKQAQQQALAHTYAGTLVTCRTDFLSTYFTRS